MICFVSFKRNCYSDAEMEELQARNINRLNEDEGEGLVAWRKGVDGLVAWSKKGDVMVASSKGGESVETALGLGKF